MHPTDGVLRAMLDEWIAPPEHKQLQHHVDGCAPCRERLTRIRKERLAVNSLLEELEAPVLARFADQVVHRAKLRRDRRRVLVAAAATLFIVTAAGATIRAGGVSGIIARLTSPSATAAAPRRPSHAAEAEGLTSVTLQATDRVEIDFAGAQPEGELRIVLGADPRVTVMASQPVPYVLGSGKVAIANQGARASYRVALPRDLELATIRVAERVIFTKRRSTLVTKAMREKTDSFRILLSERGNSP